MGGPGPACRGQARLGAAGQLWAWYSNNASRVPVGKPVRVSKQMVCTPDSRNPDPQRRVTPSSRHYPQVLAWKARMGKMRLVKDRLDEARLGKAGPGKAWLGFLGGVLIRA